MTAAWGIDHPVAPIRRALVRPPDRSFAISDPRPWGYPERPDLARARREHAALVDLLLEHGIAVERHGTPLEEKADAIFVFDPVLVTSRGTVLLRMGKSLRRGEEDALASTLERLGVPILGRLEGNARAEGGDLLRLDAATLVIGLGERTNREGARQLARLLAPESIEVETFDLPFHRGPASCLHLRSLVSLLDDDLAVAYRPLLPARLVHRLESRGEIVDVPDEELDSQGPNVLALAPRRCLVLEGSPETRRRLERRGCRIVSYRGDEISHKAGGGPTCLVLPLRRAPTTAERER
ncbi:MAG: arginine deiminase family protein [Thermoanaerobaculia bacterium]|nr:arginine deiminase family protein [Thermoanaerobaculia bacterium]